MSDRIDVIISVINRTIDSFQLYLYQEVIYNLNLFLNKMNLFIFEFIPGSFLCKIQYLATSKFEYLKETLSF